MEVNTTTRLLSAACLAIFPAGLTSGQDQQEEAPFLAGVVVEHTDDPVFDRYVDLGMIAGAVDMLDGELLADLTLQLAEGERVLGRSHHAGSSLTLARLAMQVAIQTGDGESLKRLGVYADRTANSEMAREIAAASKLAGASRDQSTEPMLESLESHQLSRYLELRRQISVAILFVDDAALKALLGKLESGELDDDLPNALQQSLIEKLNGALTRNSKLGSASRSGEETGQIDKLLGASRQHGVALGRIVGDKSLTLMGEFMKVPGGLQITSLEFNSPLQIQNLQPGDILRSFDGISITDTSEVDKRVHGLTRIEVERNGVRGTINVNLPNNTMLAGGGGPGGVFGGTGGRPGGGGGVFGGTGGRPGGGGGVIGGGGIPGSGGGFPTTSTPTVNNVRNGRSFGQTGHWVSLSDGRNVFVPGRCNGNHHVTLTPGFNSSGQSGLWAAMATGQAFLADF